MENYGAYFSQIESLSQTDFASQCSQAREIHRLLNTWKDASYPNLPINLSGLSFQKELHDLVKANHRICDLLWAMCVDEQLTWRDKQKRRNKLSSYYQRVDTIKRDR